MWVLIIWDDNSTTKAEIKSFKCLPSGNYQVIYLPEADGTCDMEIYESVKLMEEIKGE